MSSYQNRGGNGGRRPGAGRPKGAIAKQSQRDALSLRQRHREMPVDYMLRVMNDEKVSDARRDRLAKHAAPYVHPRLAAIHVRRQQRYSIDPEKLDDSELAQLEHLLLKCQVPSDDDQDDEFMAILPPTVKA